MNGRYALCAQLATLFLVGGCQVAAIAQTADAAPTADAWRALARLPDWSGVWVPDVADQRRKERGDPAPWAPIAQQQIDVMFAEDKAGRPKLLLDYCLPHGMPSWMLMTHNAMEILITS